MLNIAKYRVLQGIANLIQKPPSAAIKDCTTIGEAEIWSTYFDPMLSVLITDPENLYSSDGPTPHHPKVVVTIDQTLSLATLYSLDLTFH